jgi:hypothetical protein
MLPANRPGSISALLAQQRRGLRGAHGDGRPRTTDRQCKKGAVIQERAAALAMPLSMRLGLQSHSEGHWSFRCTMANDRRNAPDNAVKCGLPRSAHPGARSRKQNLRCGCPLPLQGEDSAAGLAADDADSLPARSPRRGLHGVKQVADRGNDVEVRALVAAADIAGLADDAALADDAKGVRVMLHIEPRSSRRHRPAASRARGAHDDHVRDQLLREVIGPVTVGTVVNTVE